MPVRFQYFYILLALVQAGLFNFIIFKFMFKTQVIV